MENPPKCQEINQNTSHMSHMSQDTKKCHTGHTGHAKSHGCHTGVTLSDKNVTLSDEKLEYQRDGIAQKIKEYIDNSIGYFTNKDIDYDLGLEKRHSAARRKQISRSLKNGDIIRTNNSTYRKRADKMVPIDIKNININKFDINLPLGLNELVEMPEKSILVISGTSNSGKTALAIDLIKRNLSSKYSHLYMMSEMGSSEYGSRLKNALNDQEFDKWDKKVISVERSSEFSEGIAYYTENGLTVIDYLEAPKGDYSMITHEIKQIYDSIKTGVCIICMQKAFGVNYARGGQGTTEKARLFLSMEQITETDDGSMVCITITKAKNSIKGNINKKELHVLMSHKKGIIQLSKNWKWHTNNERNELFESYTHETDLERKIRFELE